MNFPIKPNTLYLTLHGSHAYGMSRPESDIDIKGIAIPPKEYFLGFSYRFEQFEGNFALTDVELQNLSKMVGREVSSTEVLDSCIYDLRKFFDLAAECNPNIIEILYTDEATHLFRHKVLDDIFENRDLFLSSRANFRFRGYAMAQLKRIKTHRKWLLNPPQKKPEREDFGLPLRTVIPADQLEAAESLIKKKVEDWVFSQEEMTQELLSDVRHKTIDTFKDIFSGLGVCILNKDEELDQQKLSNAAGKLLGYSDNFLELLDKERHYKSSLNEYKQYKEWELKRNPDRAELERKYGYDSKHASHLVRLMRMAKEILLEGKVLVKRPDAKELLEIRNGSWSYDKVIEWAEQQDLEIQAIYDKKQTPLPRTPDVSKLNLLCINTIEKFLGINNHV